MFTPFCVKAATRRWRLAPHLLTLLLIIPVMLGALVQPSHAAQDSRVLPQLAREAAAYPNQTFRIVVTRIGKHKDADAALRAAGGKKLKDLYVDAYVAELSGKEISKLGRHPKVKFISYDAPMVETAKIDTTNLGTVYPGAVAAPGLWPATSGSQWTGKGVGVAVLDTGVNKDLRDFNDSTGTSRIITHQKFSSDNEDALDAYGHGTHVAGIVAGNSWHRSETALKGKYVGIAPEAGIIDVKVSNDNGVSYISDVVDAIEWVIKERQTYNIRVMNLSLVSSVAESAYTSTLAAAVERAWFNGIFVVVSAGNGGPNTMQYAPANDPFVVTVGAADPVGTVTRSDDGMAPWSSYGTTQDGHTKPDVVAPGRNMVAPLTSSSALLAKQMPERIVDGQYLRLSGTSMAAPVVSGLAALTFQAHPTWTNDQVKWLLLNTSTTLGGDTPFPGQGAGLVDAASVVQYTGTPGYANQGLTINEQLRTLDGTTNYSSANWSTSNWSTSNWSTSNWSTSNWSTSNWSTSNWSTSNWTKHQE